MSTKTLSNGTLSLRFMQNAQRAKQQTQVQAEQAKINDDAEWYVSQEVRDSWGIGSSSSSSQASSSVIQESSYLPFLFPGETARVQVPEEGTSNAFKGRRSFKRGKEVTGEEAPIPNPESPPKPSAVDSTSRMGKRPVSISGFKSTSTHTSKKPVAVRSLISQPADVGTDMKSGRRQKPDSHRQSLAAVVNARTGFMKPAGVDAPPEAVEISTVPLPGSNSRADSIIRLARSQTTNLRKRSRDDTNHVQTPGEPAGSLPTPGANEDTTSKKIKKEKSAVAL